MDTSAVIVGFVGIALGAALTALLTRQNERRSHADELLAQATNDAIALVAAGHSEAQARYASAVSRVTLHGSPRVVATWRTFQDDATTETDDGRRRLVAAVQSVRTQLGHGDASDSDLHVLMFGPGGPRPRSRQT
jgi:type II secretory pathway pseudopilin PulG